MRRFLKITALSALVLLPICAGILWYIVHLLSIELDSKFYTAVDAIPTKVYSRNFWLKPTKLVSLAELRRRLAERSYQAVKSEAELIQGTYFENLDPNQESGRIHIFLRNFVYPPSIEKLFFDEHNVGTDRKNHYAIDWRSGEVQKIQRVGPEGESSDVDGLALEPVLIAQLNSNDKETREAIPLREIPYTLLQAIVSVEDQRFLEHSGVDPKGILRSIWVNVRAGEYQQGASTITQQMVRNIYLSRTKSLRRKLKEMMMAILIELKFSKDQIIEKYLNEVYFGQIGNLEIRGVSQAAKYYFSKSVVDLSVAEQALLAALIRGPFYYSPSKHFDRAKQRQELVLQKMLEGGVITKPIHDAAVKEKLDFAEIPAVLDRAPYFTDFVKAQLLREIPDEELVGVGYNIFSTLDSYYQKIAEEEVASSVKLLEERLLKSAVTKRGRRFGVDPTMLSPLQGAFLLIDPKTSHLLAIVGGKSYKESNYNRALYMRRQIGSIVKPFVFLSGLLYGKNLDGTPMNAVSKLDDSPFTYKFDRQEWQPKNYEPTYEGAVTLRYALANSLNVPTARLAIDVGLDKVASTLKSSGVEIEIPELPSLALGAIEVPPIQVARAYATIANFGIKRDVTSILAITDNEGKPIAQFVQQEEQMLPVAETANLVEMMRSIFTEGTAKGARALGFTYPAVGKTGTTNEYRDAWFCGFTSQILGLAWVGYDRDDSVAAKQRNLQKLTGASGALPLWINIMNRIHKGIPERDILTPDGALEKINVDLVSGARATEACQGKNVILESFTTRNVPQTECE